MQSAFIAATLLEKYFSVELGLGATSRSCVKRLLIHPLLPIVSSRSTPT